LALSISATSSDSRPIDFSNAASEVREDQDSKQENHEEELSLSTELLEAFQSSLRMYHVELHFTSGPWSRFTTLDSTTSHQHFDLILTSETIYRCESYKDLISIIKSGISSPSTTITPKEASSDLVPSSLITSSSNPTSSISQTRRYALVASKVLYFGVGGGIDEFSKCIRAEGCNVEEVWSNKTGVGRKILQIFL
jgi:protein-histidine N-methyltransferase